MSRNGVEGRVFLERITKHHMVCAHFTRCVDDVELRYINTKGTGWFRLLVVEPRGKEGLLFISCNLNLRQVRTMMKRLGFKKISGLPKSFEGGHPTHRWINFESSTLY